MFDAGGDRISECAPFGAPMLKTFLMVDGRFPAMFGSIAVLFHIPKTQRKSEVERRRALTD